jgi:hypothetical protein
VDLGIEDPIVERGDLPMDCPWPLPHLPDCQHVLLQGGFLYCRPLMPGRACLWNLTTPAAAVHQPAFPEFWDAGGAEAWRTQPQSRPLPIGLADTLLPLLPELAPWVPPGLAAALVGHRGEFRGTLHWHWTWLHVEESTFSVNDLQQSNPALANLLAEACATWPRADYLRHLSWRLRGPQTELLHALGWLAEPWVARLLRRLRGPLCQPELLRRLRHWVQDAALRPALRDLPQWAQGDLAERVLTVLFEDDCPLPLLWRTLRGEASGRLARLETLVGKVRSYRGLAMAIDEPDLLSTIESRTQLAASYRQLLALAVAVPRRPLVSQRSVPRPRLASGTGVVQLNTVADVVEVGEKMGNCLASYISMLQFEPAEQLWLWQGAEPVAVHVRFDTGERRWRVVEAKGRGNRPLTTAEEEAVQQWVMPARGARSVPATARRPQLPGQ